MAAPTNIWNSNIAAVQAGGVNILANLLDPELSSGRMKLITATYTMTGNELPNDVINWAKVPSGSLVDIDGSLAGNGIAGTATVSVGDNDTQAGTVSYDPARYSSALNVAANSNAPVVFTGGTVVTAPAEITDDWVFLQSTFATLVTPVAGKVLIARIKVSMLD